MPTNCGTRAKEAVAFWERDGRVLSTGKFVSEMTFGFWFSLTTNAYATEWRAALHKAFNAFNGKAPSVKWVRGRLFQLKQMRNRMAHHEIIWTRDLADDRDAAIGILGALHPELLTWTAARVEAFNAQLDARPYWASPPTI